MSIHYKIRVAVAAFTATVGLAGVASAQTATGQQEKTDLAAKPAQRATERVTDALGVVRQLEAEPRMKQLLQQAKGVLIVPSYGRAALGVGAHGGAGLLLLLLLLKRAVDRRHGTVRPVCA